jgi:hypothetical protein
MYGEMIRFVVRRLCFRNRDDPSVVNGCTNTTGRLGTTDYLNVSEMLMVKGSAFAKQPTIRSPMDALKIRFAPAKRFRQVPPGSWWDFIPPCF